MKRNKLYLVIIAMLVLSILFASGCNNKNENANKVETGPVQTEDIDPLGKYDPPIEVTFVRSTSASMKPDQEGGLEEDNVWTRLYEEEYGIKVKFYWMAASGDQYTQKMNVMLATGDYPDFFPVNGTQLKQLAESDAIMPVTELLDKWIGEDAKKLFDGYDSGPFIKGTINGELMGIPVLSSSTDQAFMIWLRKDWLDNLDLSEPKTMSDVLKISEAFTKMDPDGNSKDDTTGLGVSNSLFGGDGSLTSLFNSYHAYPGIWVEDGSGNLVYGSTQPEMKTALKTIVDLYKDGQIDNEFGVKDNTKLLEGYTTGKIGMFYGVRSFGLSLSPTKRNDKNADWRTYPIVSVDEEPAKPQIKVRENPFYVINKDAKHPEAIVKMLNVYNKIQFDTDQDIQTKYVAYPENQAVWQLSPINGWETNTRNIEKHLQIAKALETGDDSEITSIPGRTQYGFIKNWLETEDANTDGYGWMLLEGPEGSDSINKYSGQFLFFQLHSYCYLIIRESCQLKVVSLFLTIALRQKK